MVQFWLAISHTFCTAENTCELFHIVFTATQNVQCQNMSSSRGVNAQTWWYQLLSQVSPGIGRILFHPTDVCNWGPQLTRISFNLTFGDTSKSINTEGIENLRQGGIL